MKNLEPWIQPAKHIDRLGFVIEETILRRLCTKDGLWTQHIERHDLRMLEKEMLSEGDSQLEQLLVRRISLCYLTLHYFESMYMQDLQTPKNARSHALLLQRLHQANERYISAVRTLAQIRKMKLPSVQVNIAEKQINVAG